MSEFDLIRRHFARVGAERADVRLGVGDDCALLKVPAETELAVSIDTLVAGIHFFTDCDPEALGHKSLAVGLSDLAAMGAEPAWATLAITLPRIDDAWVTAFARGFSELAAAWGVALVGGDTTSGPLAISVQVHGFVPAGHGLTRGGASPGDLVCISGTLGDAGLALLRLGAGEPISDFLRGRLERPSPRIRLGLALRGIASAGIDLSDGMAADLGHILERSGVAAVVELGALPLSTEVAAAVLQRGDWNLPVAAGDDYELCFTLPPARRNRLGAIAAACECPIRVVGQIADGGGLVCRLPDGATWQPQRPGYDHFPT